MINLHLIYIFTFFISIFIVFLLKNDIQKFNLKLYDKIEDKIWIKLYCIISIIFIHLLWLFNIIFVNMNDNLLIYGFPLYLLIPYIIYVITDILKKNEINNLNIKLDKLFNHLISIYFIFIIIFVIVPDKYKKNTIKLITNILNKLF